MWEKMFQCWCLQGLLELYAWSLAIVASSASFVHAGIVVTSVGPTTAAWIIYASLKSHQMLLLSFMPTMNYIVEAGTTQAAGIGMLETKSAFTSCILCKHSHLLLRGSNTSMAHWLPPSVCKCRSKMFVQKLHVRQYSSGFAPLVRGPVIHLLVYDRREFLCHVLY